MCQCDHLGIKCRNTCQFVRSCSPVVSATVSTQLLFETVHIVEESGCLVAAELPALARTVYTFVVECGIRLSWVWRLSGWRSNSIMFLSLPVSWLLLVCSEQCYSVMQLQILGPPCQKKQTRGPPSTSEIFFKVICCSTAVNNCQLHVNMRTGIVAALCSCIGLLLHC